MTNLSALRPQNDANNPSLEIASRCALLLGQSTDMPLREQDAARLSELETFRFGVNDSRPGWILGHGPTVVLLHGYGGRGAQMIRLAEAIAAKGFRSVFFDAGGHGASRSEKIGFFTFINDTRDLFARLDTPVHAMIGHSAGALAAMRARELYGVSAGQYAAISAPIYPYVPLNSVRATGVPEDVIDLIKLNLADQFRCVWSDLVSGKAFKSEPEKKLLLIYDRDDQRVQHEDADQIGALWPQAEILKTQGYGHNKILSAPETLARISSWL